MKLDNVQDIARELRGMFDRFGTLNPTVEIKVEGEHINDPSVTAGGFIIARQGGLWYVAKVVHDPGVRYHSDGSGTPPSDDIADVLTNATVYQAVAAVFKGVVEERVERVFEAIGEEETAEMDRVAATYDFGGEGG